ncbi:MAG: hypothetical protein EAZ51_08895 [Sphingobacteriales bacterium]|nr:MAG: hypothetical protein EAZ64_04075 [Sphingobacteriales bacterium]TAF78760.1 MAG: hypothetical protein EAZ51_08895 [Sphingobacteriales bacterium]
MKLHKLQIVLTLAFITALAACKKNKTEEPILLDTEHKYINVLVSDELTNQLSLVNPADGKVTPFSAKFAKSALYTTGSGRFASIIHRDNNTVEIFDSGFEFHGDHVDVKGTPKFGALIGDGLKPTHFKTKANEIIVFNDGDGTLSVANEAEFHTAGAKMRTISAGNLAHHGAMTKFNNGNYAITVKDGSIAGSLPERVKIIDGNGVEVVASTIQTKGIHGNASNGLISIFGSASGILMVSQAGVQELIPHPAGFDKAWFGTILEAEKADKFIGYTAAKGAYFINPTSKTVTPIFESADIMQCKVDFEGQNLHILLHNGLLKIYNLSNGSLVKEGNVMPEVAKDDKQKPTLEATKRYTYLTMPKMGELYQIDNNNLADIKKIKVSNTPYRLTIFGFENSQSH